jgi:hypothetical protein
VKPVAGDVEPGAGDEDTSGQVPCMAAPCTSITEGEHSGTMSCTQEELPGTSIGK